MIDSSFGAFLAYSLLAPLLLIGVIALAITVVAGGKEPDPTGLRVRAAYLAVTCFVSLFFMVGSVFAVTTSIVSLVGESDAVSFSEDEFEFGEEDDARTEEAVSAAVLAALIGGAGAAVFFWHRRRMEELIASVDFAASPARRAIQAYHYTVAFVAAFTALAAAVAAAYSLYRIAAPDYAAPGAENERTRGARTLLSSAALLAVSGWLFLRFVERPREWEPELTPAAAASTAPPEPPEIDLAP